ncbi:MAG: hypothetical protein IJI87_07500 [Mogibacterium sp.]|nr:hypothetical protein [Mogibacterium sp.]
MAQNVIINGVTYQSVPEVNIPKSGGGTAKFMDTDDANASASDILSDKTAYVGGEKITGQVQAKAAAEYTPTTSDQTIAAGQYLSGAQTIKGDSNLQAQYIANGVSLFGVTGTLSSAVISQDSTTKVLSIS